MLKKIKLIHDNKNKSDMLTKLGYWYSVEILAMDYIIDSLKKLLAELKQ